jgi:predicted TIM-barrel fold metal-dependent hydrolase
MKIIDTHHHFWSVKSGNYAWLENRDQERLWGKPADIPSEYLPEDLLADAGDLDLVKSVHVQCGYDPSRPVDETKWLQGLADAPGSGGFPHAIVAFADLSRPDVDEVLSQHREYKNVRGIRHMLNRHKNELWHMSDRDYLKDDTWRQNFSLLAKYNLSFDLQLYYHQIDDAISLAKDNPEILFILNHAGMPVDRDTESIEAWRLALERLAECSNVVAKISGLGMCDWKWTVDSIRPFVLGVIKAFGVDRCMFASNFPVDKNFSDYASVWNAYDEITAEFSEEVRMKLFHDNAETYYRL